ncbi:MAG: inositol monophosphatase [Candidatus Nomurabacteria bacterium]|nr:inositol monophosphatase [Candidatus Nomurabacteria bacterium]USN87677.1 MAG: inositol monophosphatase [Candidatus Nomurabacteria bacterium]
MNNLSTDTEKWAKELEVAKGIAYEAGEIMRKYFDGDQQLEKKEDGSPVTIADKEINSMVIKSLSEKFPEDGVVGEEESTAEYGEGRRWICDPIDGTWAFITGVPTCMFSLALVEDGVPVVGVAYDPFLDRLYYATIHSGAYCNDTKIYVSDRKLEDGVIAIADSLSKIRKSKFSYLDNILSRNLKTVPLNGAVYKGCLVATGRLVGYLSEYINTHDVAAAHLITEEAGGKVTSFSGDKLDYKKSFKGAVFSNKVTHQDILDLLKD